MMPYVPPLAAAAATATAKTPTEKKDTPSSSITKMPPLTTNGIFHWSIENSDVEHLKKEAEMLESHTTEEAQKITSERLKKLVFFVFVLIFRILN